MLKHNRPPRANLTSAFEPRQKAAGDLRPVLWGLHVKATERHEIKPIIWVLALSR